MPIPLRSGGVPCAFGGSSRVRSRVWARSILGFQRTPVRTTPAELDAQTLTTSGVETCCTQQPLSATVNGLMPRLRRLYITCHLPVAAWKVYLLRKRQTDADVSKRSLPLQPSWGTGATPPKPALRRGEHRTESHRAVGRSGASCARQASRRFALVREADPGEASDADGQSLSATPSPWDLLP